MALIWRAVFSFKRDVASAAISIKNVDSGRPGRIGGNKDSAVRDGCDTLGDKTFSGSRNFLDSLGNSIEDRMKNSPKGHIRHPIDSYQGEDHQN